MVNRVSLEFLKTLDSYQISVGVISSSISPEQLIFCLYSVSWRLLHAADRLCNQSPDRVYSPDLWQSPDSTQP